MSAFLTGRRDLIDELVDWQLRQREGAPSVVEPKTRDCAAMPEPHLQRDVIDACPLCDSDGYRPSGCVCDHVDRSEVAKRGMAKIRAVLKVGRTK
jgi:hypothetical protein